jgi:hypothetical protein
MNKGFAAIAVASTATIASGQVALMDQIGPDDGTGIGTNITASQYFEADFSTYDIATVDNFTAAAGDAVTVVEAVISGWNGFTDPSSINWYEIDFYSSPEAAGSSLTGDVSATTIDAADVTPSATWTGDGFLLGFEVSVSLDAGEQYLAVIPQNDFATGGQTGVADSATGTGDGVFWQANPNGGFGFGALQEGAGDAAYRVIAGGGDPCDTPLPTSCTADVNGDLVVNVSDLLEIISMWGECGDGTYRPAGDVAPLPNGDCCVNVSDVLAVIGAFGEDCQPAGACCHEDGTCYDDMTPADCGASGGIYLGDETMCADGGCATGACCVDPTTCIEVTLTGCNNAGGTYRGDGVACADVDCSEGCNATSCQSPDQSGHGADGIIGATSDLNGAAGYQVADTVQPSASGEITQVCWWGMYIDFSGPFDCGVDSPGTGDDFSITYYLDDGDGTTPGTVHAGPFSVAAVTVATGNVIPSGIGDITEWEYSASHPPVPVNAGECYWISVVNNTTESCFWLWETAGPGDGRSAQDNGGWAASDYDLAWCVDIDTTPDGCGTFSGACCLPDDTCVYVTASDCAAQKGTYNGDNVACADVNDCQPMEGACCVDQFTCLEMFDTDCIDFGGTFFGEGTFCADVDCNAGPNPFDQIGADDGSDLEGNITAAQYFEPDFAIYDIATLDDFTLDSSGTVTSIEAVLNGWNGYAGPAGVTSYQVNVYSSPTAASGDLVGDVYSIDIAAANFPTWSGTGDLIQFDISAALGAGTYYFAIIPTNEFGINGQTGIAQSALGDYASWQANPAGGFGQGTLWDVAGNAAYRLTVE